MGVGSLLHLVGKYGCLAVFFGVMLESAGVPMTAKTTPSRPRPRPTMARIPTGFLSKILSFHRFSQDSKNNADKSNEASPARPCTAP
jgi:hypothetical protein